MNIKQRYRTIIFYKNYFEDFFIKQSSKVKNKIIWTFDLIEELPRVPAMYLKHIENAGDLYEMRESSLEVIVIESSAFLTKGR